jgi:hypothetical protein
VSTKTCEQKRRYRSRLDAEIASASVHAKGKDGRVYRCPVCHGWHLTGQAKGARP